MASPCSEQERPPIEMVMSRLKGVRKSLHGWVACCPAHADSTPSLSIDVGDEGQVLLNCFAGCTLQRVVEVMDITMADLFPASSTHPQTKRTQPVALTLVDLAREKMLPWKYLFTLGVTEVPTGGLQIPYHLADGTLAPRYRVRTALVAKEGSRWNKGEGEIVPYGLERLEEARKAGYLVIVEGESDCWTLWYHHFPALGVPGAALVSTLKEAYLAGIEKVYIVREPDVAGARFVKDIARRLETWKWAGKASVVTLADAKDPNELHQQDRKEFKASFQRALDRAEPLFVKRAQPASSPAGYTPSPFTLLELLARELPPVRWAIPDILPEGLTLLAGKPKLGKSWLALSVALAVAAGGVALGKQPVTQGDVLYLALEDNERRLQSRAKQLLASMTDIPSGIAFELHWPRLDQGGLIHLEEYLQAHPNVRLVVVDTWAKISPHAQSCQRSQYEGDYESLTPLKQLADTYRISILAVHHLRKMGADDVLDEITGSTGMTGAVDGALILKRERGQGEATLFVTGRDIEQEQQLALTFDSITATWTLEGNAEEFKRTKERQEVIDLLTEHLPEGMSPRQVAEALDKNYHTTRSLLRKMEDAGEVQHINHHYVCRLDDHQCNHRNQMKVEHAPQPGQQGVVGAERRKIDYTDYGDYSDYSDDTPTSNVSDTNEAAEEQGDVSLQHELARAETLESEDVQHQHHDKQQGAAVISVINRNQCNQCNQCNQLKAVSPQVKSPCEETECDIVPDVTFEPLTAQQACAPALQKNRCPHHPHARWVRFDPAGQVWCDRMDCWDCYRLMKIGEALGYPQLLAHASGTVTIGRGIESWSSFVISKGSFAVLTATQQAAACCVAAGVEVPDLSSEVHRLVSAW